jgi:hypothetical protein
VALAARSACALDTRRPLSTDAVNPDSVFAPTHAITPDASSEQVWPPIAQMVSGDPFNPGENL